MARGPTARARVNRDDLRRRCHDGLYLPVDDNGGTEHIIATAQLAMIEALLRAGVDVSCDNTNIDPNTVNRLRQYAADAGSPPVAVIDLTDVPVEESRSSETG